jgi:hypothetical protein
MTQDRIERRLHCIGRILDRPKNARHGDAGPSGLLTRKPDSFRRRVQHRHVVAALGEWDRERASASSGVEDAGGRSREA